MHNLIILDISNLLKSFIGGYFELSPVDPQITHKLSRVIRLKL